MDNLVNSLSKHVRAVSGGGAIGSHVRWYLCSAASPTLSAPVIDAPPQASLHDTTNEAPVDALDFQRSLAVRGLTRDWSLYVALVGAVCVFAVWP